MKKYRVGEIEYYKFNNFEKSGLVKHCFSTRKGGVSEGCAESMNLSFRKQDKDENVFENYRLLCDAVGFNYNGITFSNQVHETDIKIIGHEDIGKGFHKKNDSTGADAIITQIPGVVLTTFYADCVPIYYLDTAKKVIALAHAGWRGTVEKMAQKTVIAMQNHFGSCIDDIIAGIGPSIGKCCFEVDNEVRDKFIEKLPFSYEFIEEKDNGKYYIDLWKVNEYILISSGIRSENIEISNICTKCNPQEFYSHRNMGLERGSMAAMMELMER